MKTTLIIVVVFLLSIGGYMLVTKETIPAPADDAATSTDDRIRGPEEATIAIGQTKTITGVSVTVDGLVSDSRCPEGVQCVWAGTVIISTTLSLDDTTKSFEMTLGAPLTEFEGYFVSLVSVTPYPKTDMTINQNDYMLTFNVTPITGSSSFRCKTRGIGCDEV